MKHQPPPLRIVATARKGTYYRGDSSYKGNTDEDATVWAS